MPSPAIDTNISTRNRSRYKLWWFNNPPKYDYDQWLGHSNCSLLRKPATIVNPIREDGTRAMSGYSTEWYRGTVKHGTLKVVDGGHVRTQTWSSVPSSNLHPHWQDVDNAYAFTPSMELGATFESTTRTLGKLSQKKWDLGVTALELRQTAGLVTDLAHGMVGALDSLLKGSKTTRQKTDAFLREVSRDGDFYRAAHQVGLRNTRVLEIARERWMQYQFGVRPLVRDIHDAGQYLSDRLFGERKLSVLIAVKAGAQRRRAFEAYARPLSKTVSYLGILQDGYELCQSHCSVVYELPTGQVSPITELGLDNPWSIAWEVSRLSWMVDYAVGIGDWLSSFTAANGLIFREGCRSTLRRLVVQNVTTRLDPHAGVDSMSYSGDGPVYIEHGHFKREVLTRGLMPAVLPSVKSKLGLVQLANSLMALSHVARGGPAVR